MVGGPPRLVAPPAVPAGAGSGAVAGSGGPDPGGPPSQTCLHLASLPRRRLDHRTWQQQPATYEVSAIEFPCALSPDGAWLATGRYGGPVRLRSLSGPPRTNELAFPGAIQALAFSPDGRLLAAATQQGVVKVWEVPSGREVQEFRARSQNVFAIVFSPDGRRLATGGEGEGAVMLWDVITWQELLTLRRPGVTLDRLAFSSDGGQLTAFTPEGETLLWRVPSFAEIEAKEKGQRGQ